MSALLTHSVAMGPAASDMRWLAVAGGIFACHVAWLYCVAEDAFIAFRFARNLAHGYGLSWNPGDPPVEGFTDFLWVALCSLAIRAGLDVAVFAQVASIVAGAAVLILTYVTARRRLHLPPQAAAVPALLLACAGPLVVWSSSGMEMTLFTLLILLAAYLFAGFSESGTVSTAVLAAIALVLATLTRPEGLLATAVFFLAAAGFGTMRGRRPTVLALAATLYVAFIGTYFAWRYSYFGFPLPNTYYAKTGGGLDQVLRGALLAFLFYMQFVVPLAPVVFVAIWEGGFPRMTAGWRERSARLTRHTVLASAVLLVSAHTLYTILVGGDYMAMHRFFVPVLPFIYLLLAPVFAFVASRVNSRSQAVGYALLVGAAMSVTGFPSTPLERSFFYTPPQQNGNYRGVQFERWHVARLSTIGKFFHDYRRHAGESLATSAIGAIGFYADMRVLDFHGLVDVHIAHLPPPPDLGWKRPGHGRQDLAYTFSLKPTYVMFSRELSKVPIDLRRYLPGDLLAAVERDYVHRSAWLEDNVTRDRGYFTFLERRESARRRDEASVARGTAQGRP